ncbi:MAG: hypothetical protein WAM06_08860, partial [Methyloceanibacter sp.]
MTELLHTKLEKAKAEHAAKLKVAGAFTSIPKGAPSPTALQMGAIYFRGVSAEPERATRWVRMAHRVLGDQEDPHMGFQLQQCGFLDTLILAFESEQRTDPGPDCGNLYIAGQ